MKLDRRVLASLAGAFALQTGIAQDDTGVSMVVTDMNGIVAGIVCEPFDCTPNPLPITAGNVLLVEMFGLGDQPYILFAGAPLGKCYTLPWVLGGIAMDAPFILEVGLVPAAGFPNPCLHDMVASKIEIPDTVPVGAEVVLQTAAWSAAYLLPAFSRAVQVTIV